MGWIWQLVDNWIWQLKWLPSWCLQGCCRDALVVSLQLHCCCCCWAPSKAKTCNWIITVQLLPSSRITQTCLSPAMGLWMPMQSWLLISIDCYGHFYCYYCMHHSSHLVLVWRDVSGAALSTSRCSQEATSAIEARMTLMHCKMYKGLSNISHYCILAIWDSYRFHCCQLCYYQS